MLTVRLTIEGSDEIKGIVRFTTREIEEGKGAHPNLFSAGLLITVCIANFISNLCLWWRAISSVSEREERE